MGLSIASIQMRFLLPLIDCESIYSLYIQLARYLKCYTFLCHSAVTLTANSIANTIDKKSSLCNEYQLNEFVPSKRLVIVKPSNRTDIPNGILKTTIKRAKFSSHNKSAFNNARLRLIDGPRRMSFDTLYVGIIIMIGL